jgi:hypothetical protein
LHLYCIIDKTTKVLFGGQMIKIKSLAVFVLFVCWKSTVEKEDGDLVPEIKSEM